MEMMLTGKPVRADKALRLGLVDRLVPARELRRGRATDRFSTRRRRTSRRSSSGCLSWPVVRSFVSIALLMRRSRSKARREHYPAPYAIVDLWARYGAHGDGAFEAEARSIAHLFTTETARNLVRVFLLQDRLKALGGKAAVPLEARARRRRRRHGRRHRRLVGAARPHRDAAGSRAGVHRAGAQARARALREAAARPGEERGSARARLHGRCRQAKACAQRTS